MKTITREEAIARWRKSRESKRECVEEMSQWLKAEYKKKTGIDNVKIEVW